MGIHAKYVSLTLPLSMDVEGVPPTMIYGTALRVDGVLAEGDWGLTALHVCPRRKQLPGGRVCATPSTGHTYNTGL